MLGARLAQRLGRYDVPGADHFRGTPRFLARRPGRLAAPARPTLYEVTGLCAALAFATDALNLLNRLAEL